MSLVSTPRRLRLAVAASSLALTAAAASAASAAAPLAFTGFEGGVSGGAVIGDINGDGIGDHATTVAGRVNVRLGTRGNPTGGGAFTIDSTGTAPNGKTETFLSPAPAGDVDGDGIDDALIAGDAGYTYVVYGAKSAAAVSLTAGPRVGTIERGSLTTPGGSTGVVSVGIGDFDGDGLDDFVVSQATGSSNFDGTLGAAIIRGGTRITTLSVKTITGPRVSLISGYKRCFTTWLYWIYPIPNCTVFTPSVVAAGDVNGDGKDDIVVDGIYGKAESLVFGRTGSATFSATAPGAGSVYLSPRLGNRTFGRYTLGAAGDVDGDGYDDLHVTVGGTSPTDPPRPAILRGRASFPATLSTTEALVPFTGGYATFVRGPIGDQDGDGRDDLLVDVQPSSTAPAAVRVAGLPIGATSVNTVAKAPLAGSDLPSISTAGAGGIQLSTPADLDGDGVRDAVLFAGTRVHRLTHADVPTDPGPGSGPATFEVEVTATMPDGLPIGGTVITKLDCGPIGDGVWLEGHELGTTRQVVLGAPAVGGDSCTVDWGALNVPMAKNCSWSTVYSHEGRVLDPATLRFTANAGGNRLKMAFTCTGGTRLAEGAIPAPHSTGDWRAFGSAYIADANATIPSLFGSAPRDVHGSIVFPRPIDPRNWKYSFQLHMSGWNGAAEGLTMAFLPTSSRGPVPPDRTSPATGFLGTPRGGLGVGGLGGTAVAFDVTQGTGDPLAQFIGITDTVPNGTSLNWLATAAAGVRLRGTPVKIDIVTANGEITVATNGIVRLRKAITLPSSAYLAFTGATNATVYQNQSIASFAMTRP